MTTVTYTDGIVEIKQSGTEIRFRPGDLKYDDRVTLFEAVGDISVKDRARVLEGALGVSFPCGTGDLPDVAREPEEVCQMCHRGILVGDLVHEVDITGYAIIICDTCYHERWI